MILNWKHTLYAWLLFYEQNHMSVNILCSVQIWPHKNFQFPWWIMPIPVTIDTAMIIWYSISIAINCLKSAVMLSFSFKCRQCSWTSGATDACMCLMMQHSLYLVRRQCHSPGQGQILLGRVSLQEPLLVFRLKTAPRIPESLMFSNENGIFFT